MKSLTKTAPALLVVAVLAAALVAPGAAYAVPSSSATPTAPLVTGDIGIQVSPAEDANSTVVLVDLVLNAGVKLPARVRLPIPPGASVSWAGEILGGSAAADVERPFTTGEGIGGKYAELTLTQSHQAQIDTGGLPRTRNGTAVSTTIEYVQSVPSTSTSFSVRTPPGASDIKITPPTQGAPDSDATGEHLYLMAARALSLGDKVSVSVSYKTPGTAGSSANQTMLIIVVGVALLAVVIALVFVQRAREAALDAVESDDVLRADEDSDVPFDDRPYDDVAGGASSADDDEAKGGGADDDPFEGLDDAFGDDGTVDDPDSQ